MHRAVDFAFVMFHMEKEVVRKRGSQSFLMEESIRERQYLYSLYISCSIKGENSAAKDADDQVSSQPEEKELYVIKKSFSGRVSDFIQSLIGNGYDLVAKPHTATWLVLFMIVTMYLTCFVAKPGGMSVR